MSTTAKGRRSSTRAPQAKRQVRSEMLPIDSIARNLRGWADTVLGIAAPATDLALGLATARARTRGQKSAIARAGAVLRRMRETAGLTLEELARSGVRHVQVLCPGFAVDCLETLEEMAVENRAVFLESGGGEYRFIACLNDREDHVRMMGQIACGTGHIASRA